MADAQVVAVALEDGPAHVAAQEGAPAALVEQVRRHARAGATRPGPGRRPAEPAARRAARGRRGGDRRAGGRTRSRRGRFGEGDAKLLDGFSGQAALALQLARTQDDRARLSLLEDRDRIARDLHDLVIQRLFATGLSLQGLESRLDDELARGRLERAVEDLDETVREIRRTIFSLRTSPGAPGLRAALHEVVDDAARQHPQRPVLRIDGPVDTVVPPALVADVRAVVSEALANAARHARRRPRSRWTCAPTGPRCGSR